jgi:hypothetical protein
MDGLQRLLDFAEYLRSQRMPFLLEQLKEDAVTVSFGTFGNRFRLDFHEDRVSIDWYKGNEELIANLRAIQGLIDAEAGAGDRTARVVEPGDNCAPQQPSAGMRRLLDFTAGLRRRGIAYGIEQQACDSVEVSFIAQGKRLEVEFFADGVLCSCFEGQTGIPFDMAVIQEEVESFNRPFELPLQTRGRAGRHGVSTG